MKNDVNMTDEEKKIRCNISNWASIRNTIDGYHLLRSGSGIELKWEELQKLINGDGEYIHIYLGSNPTKETVTKETVTKETVTKETVTVIKEYKREMLFYFVNSANDVEKPTTKQIQQIIKKKFVEPQIGNKSKFTAIPNINPIIVEENISEDSFENEFKNFVEQLMDFVQLKDKNKPLADKLIDEFGPIINKIDNSLDNRKIANDCLTRNLGSVFPTFLWLFYGNKWFEELQEGENIVQVFKIGKKDFKNISKALEGKGSAFIYFTLKKKDNENKIDIYISACQPEDMGSDNNYASMIKHISADVATPCPPYCGDKGKDKGKSKDKSKSKSKSEFPLLPPKS